MNLNNGNMNNNNTYNRYYAVGAVGSVQDIDGWEEAERNFYKNKHRSLEAQRIHIHPFRVIKIARLVESGNYIPKPGYRFALFEPSPREIFAAFCEDRLVHHYVAPYISDIAERIHQKNGSVSHGNRIGHSAQTGAEQIRDYIIYNTKDSNNVYIAKVDIQSCFPSVPKDKAFQFFEECARECGKYDARMLDICRILIMHDPVNGCITLSNETEINKIPERKRLKSGVVGFPIGNFYSQIVVNLYLAIWDASIAKYGVNPRFVDDKVVIAKDKKTVLEEISVSNETVHRQGLTLHRKKVYIQPACHGVNFCGRTIKGDRIYLSNRTIKKSFYRVKKADASENVALSIRDSVNSYLGLMRHCTEHKNEERLAHIVLERYGNWLCFKTRKDHYVCEAKKEIIQREKNKKEIQTLISYYNETWKDYKRQHHACRV